MSDTTLIDMTLHDVGEGLVEAQVVEWRIAPGQAVTEDQTILLISTDKAIVELPAPATGILREQAVSVGATVTLGALLARIEAPAVVQELAHRGVPTLAEAPRAEQPAGNVVHLRNVAAAPSTRRLAQQLNVDLAVVTGSGPNGRVVDEDVRRAANGTNDAERATREGPRRADCSDEERMPLSRVRLATARATATSWRDVPHIVEFRQIDATELQRSRNAHLAHAEREGVHLTYLPFFIKAASVALTNHPTFNARLDLERGELICRRHCNIGIATATDAGLIVPVLQRAESESILQLARSLDTLIDRAKRQALSLDELAEGTFTITNFGSYGTWLGTPIVRAPEVAIAGFGRIAPGVLAVDGAAVVRPILPISVATDHRVNDGVHLAAFLDTLTQALCDPVLMSDNDEGGSRARQ